MVPEARQEMDRDLRDSVSHEGPSYRVIEMVRATEQGRECQAENFPSLPTLDDASTIYVVERDSKIQPNRVDGRRIPASQIQAAQSGHPEGAAGRR